jgi:hypothetical protein
MAWYWPNVSTSEKSKSAAHQGAIACFVVGIFTAVIMGLNASLIEALLFVVAGLGIWKLSRFWAVFGLALYLIETVLDEFPSGSRSEAAGYIVVTIVLTLALITGVRGTFAYHRLHPIPKQQGPESSVVR